MDLQIIAAVIFVVFLLVFVLFKRHKVKVESFMFPLLYFILYRTEVGLKFMERTASRYREFLRIVGYCCIGVGFLGMIYVFISIITVVVKLFIAPKTAESGMALVLPFTNIPGIGYLNFIHWILAIFLLALVHEGAHGIMAKVHNIRLKSSGFAIAGVLVPLFPAAFVEPDEKELQKKPDHVQYAVFAAGPVSNILFALLILLIMSLVMNPIEARITEPVGFSFDLTNQSLPAAQAGLRSGMVINSYENRSITDVNSLLEDIHYCRQPGESIYLGNSTSSFEVILADNPENPGKPLIGITNIANERRVKAKYMWTKHIFYWFKEFLKWLGLFNILIGLVNLLPLAILDGGRMLSLALDRTMKDKEKAKKIFVFISLLLLFSLVFGLITNYFGNPLAFFLK